MKHFLFFVLLLFTYSCANDPIEKYSFFVAGHAYGTPGENMFGLHPPFVKQIPYINNYPDIKLGVLTGDLVRSRNRRSWDSVQVDIDKFSIPIHIAAGNHDRGPIFEETYDYYYSFWVQKDLFIILNPTDWNIEGKQKDFLEQTIKKGSSSANNIFLFCHELIWWAPDNEFQNIKFNWLKRYPGTTNYWSEISPILESFPNNMVIFAGDLGAKPNIDSYMYYKYKNITLVANGMGGGKKDNVIMIEVSAQGELSYKLIGIHGETPFELAKLEEYKLPTK